ncbi:MAG: hypothetical protein ACK4YT_13960, partial [Sphingomonas sp.]
MCGVVAREVAALQPHGRAGANAATDATENGLPPVLPAPPATFGPSCDAMPPALTDRAFWTRVSKEGERNLRLLDDLHTLRLLSDVVGLPHALAATAGEAAAVEGEGEAAAAAAAAADEAAAVAVLEGEVEADEEGAVRRTLQRVARAIPPDVAPALPAQLRVILGHHGAVDDAGAARSARGAGEV